MINKVKGSILERFSVTLLANLVAAATAFMASVYIARHLGAASYGNFTFLLATFAAINGAVDLGVSNAAYTFLSKGEDLLRHMRLYFFWLFGRVLMVCAAIGLLLPQSILENFWPGYDREILALAFLGSFSLGPLRQFIIHIAESGRRTFFIQTALAIIAVAHLIIVLALGIAKVMSLKALFTAVVAEHIALALAARWYLRDMKSERPPMIEPMIATMRKYAHYCTPFLFYTVIAFVYEFSERWLLQLFGGSVQQGFFSISAKVSLIPLLATTSLINIIWKEIAEAEQKGDKKKVISLFRRSSRALFFIAAATGTFIIPHSRPILVRLVGPEYAGAESILALLMLYPMFQTLGQLNATYFLATEDTKTHVAINTTAIILALPATYFLLAPLDAAVPGLSLGAMGLAIRWTLWNIAAVSVQSYIVARRQGTSSEILHPLFILTLFIALAFLSKATGELICLGLTTHFRDLAVIAASLIPYGIATALFAFRFPEHAGTSHAQINRILSWRPGT